MEFGYQALKVRFNLRNLRLVLKESRLLLFERRNPLLLLQTLSFQS
jgi:hypothetical protein